MQVNKQLRHNNKRKIRCFKSTKCCSLWTTRQCIGIGQKRPPRESGTTRPIEMPFGMLDYVGDLTKAPKFHRASPTSRGSAMGRNTHVDSCGFLCFYYLFFLEPAYRSDGSRERKFFAPEGRGPVSTRAFLCISRSQFTISGARARKWGKIAPEIGKSHCKQNSLITQ